MAQILREQNVLCIGSKASLPGFSIPVWTYFLDGVLVDTGPYSLRKELGPVFQKQPIEQAILTHFHEDHCGLAAWLQETKGVAVRMPPLFINRAQTPGALPLYRRLCWGKRKAFRPTCLTQSLSTGRYTLQVLPAPGHTQDHVVFFEPEQGWLFSGDVFVRSKPELGFYEEDMSVLIQTLQSLIQLDFDTLFCSHAGAQPKGKKLLSQKLDYLCTLQEKAKDMQKKGWDIEEIVSGLLPRKRLVERVSRGQWTRKNLVQSLLC